MADLQWIRQYTQCKAWHHGIYMSIKVMLQPASEGGLTQPKHTLAWLPFSFTFLSFLVSFGTHTGVTTFLLFLSFFSKSGFCLGWLNHKSNMNVKTYMSIRYTRYQQEMLTKCLHHKMSATLLVIYYLHGLTYNNTYAAVFQILRKLTWLVTQFLSLSRLF